MKTQFLKLAFASLLALTFSCNNEKINASDEVVTREFSIQEFTSISVGLPAQVFITQSSTHSLVIKTHENLFDVIEIDNAGNELRLKTDHNLRNVRTMNIYIHAEDLDLVGLAGSGSININDCILTDQLEVKLSGSGEINMCGNIEELKVEITGSGRFNGTDLSINDFQTRTTGSGDVAVSGNANNVSYIISGSGDVKAYDLQSTMVSVNVAGSGDVETSVSNNLNVNISGSGSVSYKGNPEVTSNITGSGTIKKVD